MHARNIRNIVRAALGSTLALAPYCTQASVVSNNTFNHDRAAPSASVSDTNT